MAGKFSNFQDKIGVFRLVWSALDSRLETFWPLWPDFFLKAAAVRRRWPLAGWTRGGQGGGGGTEMTDASRSAECRSLPTTAASHLINLHTPDQSRDAVP